MALPNDREGQIVFLNSIKVISFDDGLIYLRQLKELGGELDPNGEFKKSLDELVKGVISDKVDEAINSLERKADAEKKIGDEQISKQKLDELLKEFDEKQAKNDNSSEAVLKEIQDILDKKPSLADENIRRFIETQTKLKSEKIKAEEGVVIEEKPEDKSKAEDGTVVREEVVDKKVKEDVKLVKGKIQDLSRKLAQESGKSEVDKETISRIETEMERIIDGSEIKSNEEKINDLTRAVAKGEISQLEYKVKIKAITLELEKWASEHREAVDNYLTERFVEKVKKENGGKITEEQKQAVRVKKKLSSQVLNLDNEIKNQENSILSKDPSGKAKIAVDNFNVTAGYVNISPKETRDILEKSEKADVVLGGLKIPADSNLDAFDRVNAVLRKDEKVKGALERIQRKRALFGETKVNMYRFMGGQRKIGSQQNQNIERSIKMFTGNSLGDAMGRVYAGMANGGGMRLGLMGNISNGLKNLSATTGGFLKKSLGDLGSRLGPGIRKGLGNGITRLGGGFLKGVNGLGGALSSIGGFKVKAAVAVSAGILIAIIAGSLFLANQQVFGPGYFQGAQFWDENAVETSN